jgi:hypothetical protein
MNVVPRRHTAAARPLMAEQSDRAGTLATAVAALQTETSQNTRARQVASIVDDRQT